MAASADDQRRTTTLASPIGLHEPRARQGMRRNLLRRLWPAGILLALLAAVFLVDQSPTGPGLAFISSLMPIVLMGLGIAGVYVLLAAGLSWTLLHFAGAARLESWRRGYAKGALASGADLQDASRRLVEVQEAVRRQTADYLHGHLQSKLVAISLSIDACQKTLRRDPSAAYRTLGRIQQELKRIQDEDLRRVSRELYPAVIRLGLAPAVQSLVDRFKDVMDIELTIGPEVVSLDRADGEGLPEKLRLGVYRVTEEALTNVFKHAHANQVKIRLGREGPEHLMVSVSDNGRGFDPAKVSTGSGGQGLLGVADYAQAIGGRAQISSAPGQGATIGLLLPFHWPEVRESSPPLPAVALPPAA